MSFCFSLFLSLSLCLCLSLPLGTATSQSNSKREVGLVHRCSACHLVLVSHSHCIQYYAAAKPYDIVNHSKSDRD